MGLFSKLTKPDPKDQPPPYSPYATTQPQPSPQPSLSQQQQYSYAPPSPPKESNPDVRPLPAGWIAQKDPSSGRWFYVYTPTAHRQWEHPSDKQLPLRGQNESYQNFAAGQQQQPYYAQQQAGYYQPQYIQQQQPAMAGSNRFGGRPGLGGVGTAAAAGLGGGLLGFMLGDAISDMGHPDVVNNYYGDSYDGFDGGGFDGGGFDGGGFDF
ncbi:hypothetical protein EC973_009664 [Apophysomyces ossiformis]|uniref:WW domain-containing protein n=1 Tax=Apophysomyces ossiformis TaxID=679940 RepID=A0A8H7BL74_9FUNG|nr:hypothetical protein EC973_009664 [Apophysomyces ossiformis]